MGRSNYGRVGGRRSGSAAWQWILIGLILGLGCSAIFVLSLLTFGVLNLDGDATEVVIENTQPPLPTQDVNATVVAAVASTLAAQPTDEPLPTATPTQQQAVVVAPTPTSLPTNTPEGQPVPAETEATDTDDSSADADDGSTDTDDGSAEQTASDSGVPPELELLVSDMVQVNAGSFSMGTTPQEVNAAVVNCEQRDNAGCQVEWGQDSTPPHSVTLDTFMLEEHEVTNAQYVAFLNWMGPSSHTNGCNGRKCVETDSTLDGSVIAFDSQNYFVASSIFEQHPVVGVTWYGAQAYCEAIGRRLPTEAEWEYAARGVDGRIYPWGSEWVTTNARTSRCEADPTGENPGACIGVVEVQSFPGNVSPFGAFDMAGNAAEWVSDWFGLTYYSQPDASGLNPSGPTSGTDKVVRGGSWDVVPFFARTVHRQHFRPDQAFLWLGFRCADEFEESAVLPDTGNTGGLGTLPTIDPSTDVEPTTPPVDAAPTLPPLNNANATEVPVVPPGG